MPLNSFARKKRLSDILLVSVLLPYLLLCLTMGGFHEGVLNTGHCGHAQQSPSHDADGPQICASADTAQHNPETCQICQWLKTPSTSAQFLPVDAQFGCIYANFACYSNPVLPSLTIHGFTIRPPPFFTCFSA